MSAFRRTVMLWGKNKEVNERRGRSVKLVRNNR